MAARSKIPRYIDQIEFIKLSKKLTVRQLMDHYKVAERTIQYWRAWIRENGGQPLDQPYPQLEPVPPEPTTPPTFPEPLGKTYDDFVTIRSDRTLILGDSEIPNHDPEIFELAYTLARRLNITDLIINGDFLALDCFSNWMRSAVYKLAFGDELDQATLVIQALLTQFTRIVWVTGNHERRLAYKVDGHINIGDFFKKLSKGVEISEYAYCILKSGGQDIMVVHPKNYSRIPLSTARELAAIKLMNIVAGHTHHQSFGHDRSGRHWLVDGGCCRDTSKTRYKNVEVTTHPAWNPGVTLILDGHPYLINKQNATFWKRVRLEEVTKKTG